MSGGPAPIDPAPFSLDRLGAAVAPWTWVSRRLDSLSKYTPTAHNHSARSKKPPQDQRRASCLPAARAHLRQMSRRNNPRTLTCRDTELATSSAFRLPLLAYFGRRVASTRSRGSDSGCFERVLRSSEPAIRSAEALVFRIGSTCSHRPSGAPNGVEEPLPGIPSRNSSTATVDLSPSASYWGE